MGEGVRSSQMSGVAPIEDVVQRLLLIFSNLVVLWAAARYLEYNEKFRAFLLMLIALFTSPVYHLCMGFPKTCFWSMHKYHVVDFWTAVLSIPVVALMFVRFRDPDIEQWIMLAVIVAIGLLVTGTDSSFTGNAIVAGVSLAVVFGYLVWHRRVHGYWPEYDMIQVTLGVAFTSLGVAFFVVQDWWPPYYGYTHSYWHTLVGIGIGFFAGIRYPYPNEGDTVVTTTVKTAAAAINGTVGRVLPFTVPVWHARYVNDKPGVLPISSTTTTTPALVTNPPSFVSRFAFAPMTLRTTTSNNYNKFSVP